ncbi:MAG TPA: succinate dehydrogenase hydrophobic membrane anchor subunit [Actinomycetota bacterium]|nr:succinate dehydrogenase hydrophobic membrane anchor subunit [Actinomycetota bacterium]
MVAHTEERTEVQAPRGALGTRGTRERPAGGFELWAWLFMRISGVVLLFLAVGHVLIMHVLDEGIDRVNFEFVSVRWDDVFWQSWDWAMLSLALIHGINGLRVVVQDYVRPPGARFAVNMVFYTLGFILFVLGTVVVFTFDPSRWSGAV